MIWTLAQKGGSCRFEGVKAGVYAIAVAHSPDGAERLEYRLARSPQGRSGRLGRCPPGDAGAALRGGVDPRSRPRRRARQRADFPLTSPAARRAGSRLSHGVLREARLTEALAIIEEVGVEVLSLRDGARRLGVSHQAPCEHFASRALRKAQVSPWLFCKDGSDRKAGVSRWDMCDRISKTIVAGATALSLAAAALATAEPAAAQWRSLEPRRPRARRGIWLLAPRGVRQRRRAAALLTLGAARLLLAGSPNLFHLRSLARQPAGQRLLIVAGRAFSTRLPSCGSIRRVALSLETSNYGLPGTREKRGSSSLTGRPLRGPRHCPQARSGGARRARGRRPRREPPRRPAGQGRRQRIASRTSPHSSWNGTSKAMSATVGRARPSAFSKRTSSPNSAPSA